jgi:ketosteroid isomerase-like protein/uncharacterized protein YndB with AHSA1/START domain
MKTKNTIEIVLQFNDYVNNQDVKGLGSLMTEDHTFIDTSNNSFNGKEKALEAWKGFFEQFHDYRNTFEHIESRDDLVLITGYSTSSEKQLEGRAIWTVKVTADRVVEWRVYDDTPEIRKLLNIFLDERKEEKFMDKMHFSIVINAPKEKVWNTMLNEDTYRLWTDVFMPGSHYVGEWSEGSKILFLAPEETGKMSGMMSKIKENRPYEYVSIEYIGIVQDGKEDTSSKEAKDWAGSLENYTFKEMDGKTEVLVELFSDTDLEDEYKQMFQDTWPKALQKLKELAEKS